MVGHRAFSLIEILIACSVLALAAFPVMLSISSSIEKYSNPYSDYNIERAVGETVMWFDWLIERALDEKRDFVLQINPTQTTNVLLANFTGPPETVSHVSKNIAYRIKRTDQNPPENYRYSHLFQTMSPAFELAIYKGDLQYMTDLSIIVSVYGLVRSAGNSQ